jgi:hypothetical protein
MSCDRIQECRVASEKGTAVDCHILPVWKENMQYTDDVKQPTQVVATV